MQFDVPSFHVTQDSDTLTVHISNASVKASEARTAAENCTFGCYLAPAYLPYVSALT